MIIYCARCQPDQSRSAVHHLAPVEDCPHHLYEVLEATRLKLMEARESRSHAIRGLQDVVAVAEAVVLEDIARVSDVDVMLRSARHVLELLQAWESREST